MRLHISFYILAGIIGLFSLAKPAIAQQNFESWKKDFEKEAISKGISEKVVYSALSGISPISRIIELDRKQPEGTMTFAKYRERVINNDRVAQGRRLYAQHKDLLDQVSQKYGVQPQYIVALWGIETSYGNNTGGFGVVPALATLAYDGRRSSYFRGELINALKILDAGHISLDKMKGSWAGAMGQNQFMPSSFHAYAVDANGDGHRDIWTSLPDVFASTANYLSKSGWKGDERWGRAVKLPNTILVDDVGLDRPRMLKEWHLKGITLQGGEPVPVLDGMKAWIVIPDGINGPAYLVYDNYRVIMKWNKSKYFATSVGLLADQIVR